MVRQEILDRRDAIEATPILERVAAMKESLAAAGDEAQTLRHLPAWGNSSFFKAITVLSKPVTPDAASK